MTDTAEASRILDSHGEKAEELQTFYVYEAPVRLWHWVNAAAILVLATTGYFIATPLWSTPGEASANFVMGYIRFAHFAAGYLLAIGLLGAPLLGDRRQPLRPADLHAAAHRPQMVVGRALRVALVLVPGVAIRRNTSGTTRSRNMVMFIFMMLVAFMVCTGFALYSEGAGRDSWQYKAVRLGVLDLAEQPGHPHLASPRHVGRVVFVIVHIYAAVREDIMSRQSMISSMISGERVFRDSDD